MSRSSDRIAELALAAPGMIAPAGCVIAYLSLERPHEGNAAYTHIHEIVAGLRRRGHVVDFYAPADS